MATITTTSVTSQQLSQHNTKEDLWVAVRGKVYDLTSFAPDHPGGIDVLLECAGDDATEPFDYAGHTKEAVVTMSKFQIGTVEGHTDDDDDHTTLTSDLKAVGERIEKTVISPVESGRGVPAMVLVPIILVAFGLTFGRRLANMGLLDGISTSLRSLTTKDGDAEWSVPQAFVGGISLASLIPIVGCYVLYKVWVKTLPQERNVFSYPSVIPRRRQ